MRDFASKPKNEDGSGAAPRVAEHAFKLDGESFTARMVMNADATLAWSEFADSALQTQEDINSPAGAAFFSQFFKLVMQGGEYQRFRAHLKQHDTDADVLLEIMLDVQEAIEAELGGEAGRPTQPSSSSSGGRTATDGRRLEIISLAAAAGSDGEVEFAPQSRTVRKQAAKTKRKPA
jgi:hypothetical protein